MSDVEAVTLESIIDAAPEGSTIVVCNDEQLVEARKLMTKNKRHLGVIVRHHQDVPKWVITK